MLKLKLKSNINIIVARSNIKIKGHFIEQLDKLYLF